MVVMLVITFMTVTMVMMAKRLVVVVTVKMLLIIMRESVAFEPAPCGDLLLSFTFHVCRVLTYTYICAVC
jgi:predicted RNA-binding Zn-ribbon protein involved in translation (DUF1610 family)